MTNFDERARDWDSDPKKVERARAVAEAIRKALPLSANMTALEYGCGTGLLSFALQEDLGEITLADTSQGMLDVLSEKIAASGVTNMHPVRLDLDIRRGGGHGREPPRLAGRRQRPPQQPDPDRRPLPSRAAKRRRDRL